METTRRVALTRFVIAFIFPLIFVSPALADDGPERASAMKKHALTLESCIKKASDHAKGAAVFANVHIGKRGNFAVHIDCVVNGTRTGVTVDETGKASTKSKAERDRGNESDYPKIVQEFTDQKVTLAELVGVAERESKGTAINAWGYVKDGVVLVRVIVVVQKKNDQGVMEDRSEQLVIDPRTRKIK